MFDVFPGLVKHDTQVLVMCFIYECFSKDVAFNLLNYIKVTICIMKLACDISNSIG